MINVFLRLICVQTVCKRYICPCHTNPRFNCFSTELFARKPDIFFVKKWPATASLQRPRRCYGTRMAFYCVHTAFLLAILCALTTLSLLIHGAHNAFTALPRRSHCADGVLKMQRHPKERRTISVQTPQTTTAFAQRPLCAPAEPAELLLRCRRPYCAAMVTIRRPYCGLIRSSNNGVCFEHAQNARRRSKFYAITQRLLAYHCFAAMLLASALHAPWCSAFFLDAVGSP